MKVRVLTSQPYNRRSSNGRTTGFEPVNLGSNPSHRAMFIIINQAYNESMEDKTNPWVRANLETFNEETLALIPEQRREEYAQVMARLAFSSKNLGDALQAVQTAYVIIEYGHKVRNEFFESLTNEQ